MFYLLSSSTAASFFSQNAVFIPPCDFLSITGWFDVEHFCCYLSIVAMIHNSSWPTRAESKVRWKS